MSRCLMLTTTNTPGAASGSWKPVYGKPGLILCQQPRQHGGCSRELPPWRMKEWAPLVDAQQPHTEHAAALQRFVRACDAVLYGLRLVFHPTEGYAWKGV